VGDAAEREGLLGGVGLFRHCSRRDLARIAALAAPLEVGTGTVVVSAGARQAPLILVLDGVARAEEHDRRPLRLGRGAHVGTVSLLDGGPARLTVIAVTPMRLAVIERGNFMELLQAAPAIATRILVAVGEELRRGGGGSGDVGL
jgi:CRP-like cAMP-binding protein